MSHEYLNDFFEQYPDFDYDPSMPANSEWYRLCDHMNWGKKGKKTNPERESAYEDFKDALVHQFNTNYGTDEESLDAWQELCERLGVFPIPDTLKEAREKVKATHVNLVDLTQGADGREVRIFHTEVELSEYTRRNGRYFPAESAYAGGLLRHLLRHIFHPRSESVYKRGGRSRGRARGRGRRVYDLVC